MAQITQKISLEVAKPNFIQKITAKQFDSESRFLKVTLKNESEKIEVQPASTVTINAKRNDGSEKSFTGNVNDDGTVTVPLTYWMLELDGGVECDVSVIDTDNRKLSTTKFAVEVERASCKGNDVSDADKYEILILQGNGVVGSVNGMTGAVELTAESIGAAKKEDLEAIKANALMFRRRLTAADNMDDIVEPGIYYYQTGTESDPSTRPANCPFSNGSIIEVIATDDPSQRIIQRGTRYGIAGYSKERVRSNTGSWLDWTTHPLFLTFEKTVTTNENGNFVFTLDNNSMILAIRAIPTDTSISACSVTPYWSTSYNKWGCHVTSSTGSALTNTEVTVSIIYTNKG